MSAHDYYQPSEYEQQMIAAGFIAEGDTDPDYQEYLRRGADDEFTMTYSSWVNQKRRWDSLDAEYQAEIAPVYRNCPMGEDMTPFTAEFNRREEYLLREMSYCEQALRY